MSKQVKYKLVNTFHNTEAVFTAHHHHDGAYAAYMKLLDAELSAHKDSAEYTVAHRKLVRIHRKLCPNNNRQCQCRGMIKAGV
jgi:hypothetical protein